MDNAFLISWEGGILSLGGDAQPYWLRFSTMIILEHLPVVNCPEKNPPHTHTYSMEAMGWNCPHQDPL